MCLKNKNFIFGLLTFILITACNNEEFETAPDNIISQQKFTKILTDFLVSESAINLNIKNITIEKFDSVYTFNPLKENNVTKTQYDSTLNYYSKHPELYKQVYEDALELLSQMQIQRKAKIVADSLQTIKLKHDLLQSKRKDSIKPSTSKNKNAK